MFHHAHFQILSFYLKIEQKFHCFVSILLWIAISTPFQLFFPTLLDCKSHFHHARLLKFSKNSIMHAYSTMRCTFIRQARVGFYYGSLSLTADWPASDRWGIHSKVRKFVKQTYGLCRRDGKSICVKITNDCLSSWKHPIKVWFPVFLNHAENKAYNECTMVQACFAFLTASNLFAQR